MNEKYLVLVDSNEFRQKVLDCINNPESMDKILLSTIFAEDPKYKQAIIHGMSIAASIISYCDPVLIKTSNSNHDHVNKNVLINSFIEVFEDMAKRGTLLTGKNITQEDLLNQIVGTIVRVGYLENITLNKSEKETE